MRVYQIKVKFNVTEQIERYVYVYLIAGKHCYLIDSGVAGCQQQIMNQMKEIGRSLHDLKGIFLTHAHPDHIGTAAWFQEHAGCKIYASVGEKRWIEDIDMQYKERPIPNFYKLAGSSVRVDQVVQAGEEILLDEAFSINVLGAAGHSVDEVSYQLADMVFIGDSVPVAGDIPIYVDAIASIRSLKKIKSMKQCQKFYPAWDVAYDYATLYEKVDAAILLIKRLGDSVEEAKGISGDLDEIVLRVSEALNKPMLAKNSLFARTIKSYL